MTGKSDLLVARARTAMHPIPGGLSHFSADFIICMCEFYLRQAQGELMRAVSHACTRG
jgi:hypothetical protein